MVALWCATVWYKRQHLGEESAAKPFRSPFIIIEESQCFGTFSIPSHLPPLFINQIDWVRHGRKVTSCRRFLKFWVQVKNWWTHVNFRVHEVTLPNRIGEVVLLPKGQHGSELKHEE
ncbi:hypothetical protein TNCV_2999161 [Trichonephila clavipes]|nr:hypothetical protein TNCV_2999161 [Trichonephila clavipes]